MHQRIEVRVERAQLVWLTLGVIVSLGLAFALGFVIGRRAQRIEPAAPRADVITQIETDAERHAELTFYKKLTAPQSPVAPEPAVAVARSRPQAAPPAEIAKERTLAQAVDHARDSAAAVDRAAVRTALDAGPPVAGDYTVQVSAFQFLGEAKAFSAGLERRGFKPFVVTSSLNGRGTWYRVRIGHFTNEQTAKQAKTLLARADIPAWVLRAE